MTVLLLLSLLRMDSISHVPAFKTDSLVIEQYIMASSKDSSFYPNLEKAYQMAKADDMKPEQARVRQREASWSYSRNYMQALKQATEADSLFLEEGNKYGEALSQQTMAFICYEKLRDAELALKHCTRALELYAALQDTLAQANLFKYRAIIQSKLGKYSQAKTDISRAITLFGCKRYLMGIAVCYSDLSIVYRNQKNYDSSLSALQRSKDMWEAFGDTSRILACNTLLLKVYGLQKRTDEGINLLKQSDSLLLNSNPHWQYRLDYYYCAETFLSACGKKEETLIYHQKSDALAEELKKQGILSMPTDY